MDAVDSFERGKHKKINLFNEKVEKIREENPEKIGTYLESVGGFTGNNQTKDSCIDVVIVLY